MSDTSATAPTTAPATEAKPSQTTAELNLNTKKTETESAKPKSKAQKSADAGNGLREWLKARGADEKPAPKAESKPDAEPATKAPSEPKGAAKNDAPTAKAEATAEKIEDLGGKAPEQKDGESDKNYELRLSQTLRKLRDAEAETLKARKEADGARKELETSAAEIRKFQKLVEDGKANPLTVLEFLGTSYEELTKGIINDKFKVPEKKPALPPELMEKIDRLEKAEKDREADRVRRDGEARRDADVKSVSKYIEDNADEFPLVAGWGPAAAKVVADAYKNDAAPSRAQLEDLEETLAKEAMQLLGKARGAKALLKRNPDLKAAMMEALGVSDKPASEPTPKSEREPRSIADAPTEASTRPLTKAEKSKKLAAELRSWRSSRSDD